mgnify:FL=1|jgi:transcriptional regulator with XRE-family HTH domain
MKYKHFGEWLKAKLKEHKIFQQELAKQICVAENTVTSWTTGNREPTIRNYLWICRFIALLEEKDYEVIVLETAEYF